MTYTKRSAKHDLTAQIYFPAGARAQLDLSAQYAVISAEIRTAVERVMASQQFVLGREGAAFEEEIAKLWRRRSRRGRGFRNGTR